MHPYTNLITGLVVTLMLLQANPILAQNGVNFDANNDVIQTTFDGVLGSNNRTFEAWVYVNSTASGNIAILDYGQNSVGSRNTFNVGGNNQLSFISGGTNANLASSSNVVPDNTWTHVAFVLNSGTGYLYVNGNQVATGNLTTVNTPSTGVDLRIGQRVPGGSIPFDGSIDEVRIWNVARTASEISTNMNDEFCSIPSNLVAYYKLNEGIAGGSNSGVTTAPDASGNGNNGTLSNFSLSGSTSNWVTGATLGTTILTSNVSLTGCDSLVSPSGNYTWYTAGTYYDTVQTTSGCDSAMTITLTINNQSTSTINEEACLSYTSPSGNFTWTTSGTYTDIISNAAGCDSLITINLTIGNTADTISVSTCDSFISPSGNHTYVQSGTYRDTVVNSVSCDSIIRINLTISGATDQTEITETACFEFTSDLGSTYTTTGIYVDSLTNAVGCDSIVTLYLTIDTVDINVDKSGKTLTSLATNATYQWINCKNNEQVIGENDSTYKPEETGSYAVVITQNGCVDTSDCFNVTIAGLNDHSNYEGLTLYPNPTSGLITIYIDQVYEAVSIIVTGADGRLIHSMESVSSKNIELELDGFPGLYLVHVYADDQHRAFKIVKQ
ncbi:MAG: hypothetical protein Salg2KO_00820 [Salibacteraceae bacterium]